MAKKPKLSVSLNYKPPGPVSNALLSSTSLVNGIMGPIGSGKTSVCCHFIIIKAILQAPSPRDGVRRTRWAVIRDTYENLKRTALRTWLTWFPEQSGDFVKGPPAEHTIRFPHPSGDGTIVELHMMFIGLGDDNVETISRGWELTGAYLNEADTMGEEVFTAVRRRVGRYPSKADGGPSWYGMLCDFNAPLVGNWCNQRFILKDLPNHSFFEQPPGMIEVADGKYEVNPAAENLENLPEGYYANEVTELQADPEVLDVDAAIGRMILNRPGLPQNGKPVFRSYRDKTHYAGYELKPIAGVPIIVGTDAGRTPSAIILQWAEGWWGVLDELICESADVNDFGQEMLDLLRDRYADWLPDLERIKIALARGRRVPPRLITGYGDPSADDPNHTSNDGWLELLSGITGFPHLPAPGNNRYVVRLPAVNGPLKRLNLGRPAFLISSRCEVVRQAMMGGYHYPRRRVSGSLVYADTPAKNEFSHPMDALQNGMLGGGEFERVRHLLPADKNIDRGVGVAQARISNEGIGNAV